MAPPSAQRFAQPATSLSANYNLNSTGLSADADYGAPNDGLAQFSVDGSLDPILSQWSVNPQESLPHEILWSFNAGARNVDGMQILMLHFNAFHTLQRFSLDYTTAANPTRASAFVPVTGLVVAAGEQRDSPTSPGVLAGVVGNQVDVGNQLIREYQISFDEVQGMTGLRLSIPPNAGSYSNPTGYNFGVTEVAFHSTDNLHPGIVSWWTGDGTANDVVGSNNGTLQGGANYAPGLAGQAFSLDGLEAFVEVPDNSSLRLLGSLTVAASINANTLNQQEISSILTRENTGNQTNYNLHVIGSLFFAVTFDAPASRVSGSGDCEAGGNCYVTGATTVTTGVFHHVAGVYDEATRSLSVYLDGVLDGSLIINTSGHPPDIAANLRIGRRVTNCASGQPGGGPPNPTCFNGLIDEVQLYNRALSAAEIAGLAGLNTTVGSDVAVTAPATLPNGSPTSVSLSFGQVTGGGTTSVTTSSAGPPPPSGFKLTSPPVYYEITTTASFTGSVRVCLNWSEGQIANENNVQLFHNEGGAWVDVTDITSRNTTTNTVCGTTTSLSPFTLFEVKYPFAGFYAPVDNAPTVNVVKAGAAVPVRFSLGGDKGLTIFATGYPRAQLQLCDSGALTDVIDETVSAGGSSLSYDPTTGHYSYVWKTDKTWAGSCRQLQLRLTDGELYTAQFKLR